MTFDHEDTTDADASVDAGIRETVRLGLERGDAFLGPTGPRGPHQRLDGLGWLAHKGRLSLAQREAGRRYGALYGRVFLEGRLPTVGSDTRGGWSELNPAEARHEDGKRLHRARSEGLNGLGSLIDICDQVCGEGRRLTELERDDRRASRLEERLAVALDLLGAHFNLRAA